MALAEVRARDEGRTWCMEQREHAGGELVILGDDWSDDLWRCLALHASRLASMEAGEGSDAP